MRRFTFWSLAIFISANRLFPPLVAGADPPDPKGIEFFEKRIRPVLVTHCYECHSQGAKAVKGNLLLDTREGIRQGGDTGAAVVPGKVAASLLIGALKYDGFEMPPKGKLPDAVIADFEKWIELGAPDPRDGKIVAAKGIDLAEGRKFWSFQPIKRPVVPAVKNTAWPAADVDRFILAGLEAKGLQPVGDADRSTLVRRLHYDLTGLPPLLTEVESTPRKDDNDYVPLVDRLLASPQFGERWGRHWLDLARFAESSGGAHNVHFPVAFRYRDYVVNAFNADKPYDQFIREQLAGDLLTAADDTTRNEQLIATGFLAIGVKDLRERELRRFRMGIVEEQVDVTGRTFLGLTLACARCHDHKFDPISTGDYYALAGIFFSSEPLLGAKRNRIAEPFSAGVQPLLGAKQPFTDRDFKAMLQSRLDLTKVSLKLRDERRRVLIDLNLLKAPEAKQVAVWSETPSVRELEAQRAAKQAEYDALAAAYDGGLQDAAMAMREAKPQDCAVHIRGEDTQLGDVMPRGFPQVLITKDSPQVNRERSGRLELAAWIASPNNPLTARVMVNRIWQHLFGAGLVETPDDFGKTGQPPSNPELLDHLATRFIAEGWSVKKLIREIVLSRTYRLSSDHHPLAEELDPANRLHWRMNRRRLDSDAIVDSLLQLSGVLETSPPPARVPPTPQDDRMKSFPVREWRTPTANHRTVYQPIFRDYVPADWSVFDFPDPELVVGRRNVTTVPTQALFMINSPAAIEAARRIGERVTREVGDDAAKRVSRAYQIILSRLPTQEEVSEGIEFVQQFPLPNKRQNDSHPAAWAAFCQSLLASGEFRYLY
jgi:hypothetical protein